VRCQPSARLGTYPPTNTTGVRSNPWRLAWERSPSGRGARVGKKQKGKDSGFRVKGSGFRVKSSGFRVKGSGFRVKGSGFRVKGSGLRLQPSQFQPATSSRGYLKVTQGSTSAAASTLNPNAKPPIPELNFRRHKLVNIKP